MKRAIKLFVSLAVSAVFLWLAFRHVDIDAVWILMQQVNIPLILVYTLMLVGIQFCRGLRWGILIRPFATLPWRSVFKVSNIGILLTHFLPLRLGEFSRPILMKKEAGSPMSATLGAVVVERVIDGLVVTFFFFVTTMSHPELPAGLSAAAYIAFAIFAGAMLCVLAAWLAHDGAIRILTAIFSPFSKKLAERLTGMLDAFVMGVRSLPNVRSLVAMVGWTAAYWLLNGFGYYCVIQSFGWDLPFAAGFTLVSVLVIAIMIPAGPGFLGTFQGGLLAGFAIYGVGVNEATAFGIIVYPLTTLACLAFGLPYFFISNQRLSELVAVSPEAAA